MEIVTVQCTLPLGTGEVCFQLLFIVHCIGVARGCTCIPQGREKNFCWPNLQGKVVSAERAPPGRAGVHFLRNWGDLDGGRDYLGSFSRCFDGDD